MYAYTYRYAQYIHIYSYINAHRVYFLISVNKNNVILNKLPTTNMPSLTISPRHLYRSIQMDLAHF